MDSPIRPGELVLGDDYDPDAEAFVVDGKYATGLIPRNFKRYPVGYTIYARPFDLPLIPESEWQQRLDMQVATKSQLSNIRDMAGPNGQPIPSRDQNGKGYCWAHSTVSAALLARAVANEPYADLSAYAIACIIKNYRDEGGWNAQSVQFLAERGCPTSQFWPQRSMSRSNDKPETWENAKQHVALEWMDLDPRNMWPQVVTALLSGFALAGDFNWWGHSVGIADLVSLSTRRVRIWNSWGDSWSANGMGVLESSKATPDAAIAIRVVRPSQT